MKNSPPHPASGDTYFFTTRLADASSALLLDKVDLLRDATRKTLTRHPFRIDAIVVLPATIHTLWTLPKGDSNIANRWAMLKSLFSRDLPSPTHRSQAQIKRGDKGIWQRRFWQHLIRDAADYEIHLNMIHSSPVHACLCARPRDWPHSSIHRLVATQTAVPPYRATSTTHRAASLHLT